MIQTPLLLLSVSLLGAALASDPNPELPTPAEIPAIYSKPCQSLDLQIKFSDDGGQGIGAHIRLDRQSDGLFKRQALTAPGYIQKKLPALKSLLPVKEVQVRAWLQRLSAIDAACRAESTRAEEFDKVFTAAATEETLIAFIKQLGSRGDRVELSIHITAIDGATYQWLEGLDLHSKEAGTLLIEMSGRP